MTYINVAPTELKTFLQAGGAINITLLRSSKHIAVGGCYKQFAPTELATLRVAHKKLPCLGGSF